MWRTVYVSQPKAVSAQPVHKQRALGLPARAQRSRAGLPPIKLAQALPGRPARLTSHVVRSTGSQDEADSSSTAGPLVPTPQQQNGNLPAAQSGAGGPGKVPVQFVVPEYLTHWGQVLKVVGSLEELGSWKVEKAPSMQWNEGHTWTLDIQLPVGAVNFKIVMHDPPNSNVRWELGEDRSVLIPETTTVTGAPVGQVGVTCNFNDVHNSRVEVRPDRAYLKQQLKAVEARVLAIQEKKRKLDQRMSVLTSGLKKYDATVAMLQDGVQAAVEARRSSKESAKQLQQSPQQQDLQQPDERQQQEQQQAAAGSSNGATSDKQQQQAASKAPASFNPLGQKASIQVPILDPSQLPSFADAPAAAAAEAAAEESTAASSATSSSSVESSTDEVQPADSAAVVAANSSSSLAYGSDVSAIKASHVNETVLSATVDQLLAAAEDALARSTPSEPIPNLSVGAAGVDDVQLAEEYVEELLAAASALEQQADRRASLLLKAAQRSGDSDMAADIEQLAAAELPPIPTVEELAEAAAAAAAITVSLDEELPAAAAAAAVSSASMSSSEEAADAAVAAVTQPQEQQQQVAMEVQLEPQQQQQQAQTPSRPASRVDKDGSIIFTAESLSVDVDVKQLLAAVLSRVGIPLGGNVTISASFTPNEAASQDTAAADAMDAAAEASMDHNVDSMAANSSSSSSSGGSDGSAHDQQQEQQKEKKPQRRLSPIEAIAAVFSRGNSMDSEDESDNSGSGGSSGSSGGSNGRGQGFCNSSSNGASTQGKGRYSKAVSTGSEQPYTSSTTAAPAPNGSNGSSSGAHQPAQTTVRMDLQDLSKQLEAKEAARRAAAERVAAALAQVEEVRRSVVAANSMLRQQLLGAEGPNSSSNGSSASTSVAGGNRSSSSSSVSTSDGRVYSRYRVAHKGAGQAPAAPAADTASSSSSSAQQGNGSKPEPVSTPGASRGMPAIAATAVDPAQLPPKPRQAGNSTNQQQQQQHESEVEGEVREELSLLAALAAEVQKQSRDRTQQ